MVSTTRGAVLAVVIGVIPSPYWVLDLLILAPEVTFTRTPSSKKAGLMTGT